MFTVNNVRNGSKGADTNLLQRLLDQAGFKGSDGNRLTIDGDCGPNTVYAIKQYQAKMGLEVDGDCGPKTWKAIKYWQAANFSQPGRKGAVTGMEQRNPMEGST